MSSRAVGGASSSGRIGRLFSFILSIALLFGASSAWAADWTYADGKTYTALKYIKGNGSGGTGGPYVITDVLPDCTDTVKLRFKLETVAGNECFFCSRATNGKNVNDKAFTCFRIGSNIRVQRTSSVQVESSAVFEANSEYSASVDFNNGLSTTDAVKINGVGTDMGKALGTTSYSPTKMVIFASHSAGATVSASSSFSNKGSYYLYNFQRYSSNGELKNNFMPAKNADGVAGLYDTIGKKFYGPTGPTGYTTFTFEEWGTDRAGKKWTGLGGDNKMSNGGNWQGGIAPVSGDDIDFTIAVPFAAIEADIDATFGKIHLGTGDLPAFSGELSATGINDLERMTAYDTATDGFAFTLEAPSGQDLVWNGGAAANWSTTDASWLCNGAASAWYDHNNAIFNTAGATATLTENAEANSLAFSQPATVAGSSTLTVPTVSVAADVSATISAPTAGALTKTGAGTLTLGSSRTGETTVSEGTLKMANGATVAPANLTLGTDPTKPVVFDYAGQTLVATLTTFVKPEANVTLTNIVVSNITENIYFAKDSAPSVLTVAKGAVLDFGKHYTLNTDNEATFNIAGGTAKTKANEDNWIMQASLTGRLNINVTNGGLMEFGGEVYALTCRNAVNGSTDYENPSLYWSIVDSTLRVKNGKSVRFGHDAQNKNPKCPTGVFAATNSVIDVPYYITIGSDVAGENKAGSYTADFEDCIITAKSLRVFYDRPLNAIRLNNTRFVLPGDYDNWLYSSPEFETIGEGETAIKPITIDADGLILDTKGFNGNINSDPQGPGPITKVGKGILRIIQNQTSTSPLVCAEGETYVSDGLSVARAIKVKSGAKLTTKGIRQVALADIAFEDGAELRVDGYDSGVVPIAVTTLTLPASGTVSLTKNNNFAKGKYRILEKAGITVEDVQDRLVPATTGGLLNHSWSVEGNTLYLTVGEPMGFSWTGFAGDGKMSTPGNWLGGIAPGADDPVDFSSVDTAITVDADIDATLGAVTMGGGVVTFTGSLTATSFTDNSKIAVGANSTVTLDGNLEFTSGNSYITYKVGDGGAFVVTGTIKATGTANVLPYATASSGWIIAKGLENAETEGSKWNFRLNYENVAKWVVGEDGFSGAQYFWSFNDVNSDTTIKADADFTIATWLSAGSLKGKGITIDTSGWTDPNADYTITANCGFTGIKPLTIKGGGTFICNYTPQKIDGSNGPAFSGAVTVTDAATLAINAGKKVTSGAITIDEGAALIAKGAGVVDLSGNNVALKSNAKFGFEFERFSTAPQFKFGEGKFSFPEFESTNVVLKISGIYPSSSPFVLTSGYDFRNVTSVTLAEDSPKWVKCIYVDDDGNIVLLAKPIGTRIIVR